MVPLVICSAFAYLTGFLPIKDPQKQTTQLVFAVLGVILFVLHAVAPQVLPVWLTT